jgi:hypothetical protein
MQHGVSSSRSVFEKPTGMFAEAAEIDGVITVLSGNVGGGVAKAVPLHFILPNFL